MNKNKTALITGSGKRIGAAISRAFHSRGYNIIAHFNSSSKEIESLEEELNKNRKGSCITLQANFFETRVHFYFIAYDLGYRILHHLYCWLGKG